MDAALATGEIFNESPRKNLFTPANAGDMARRATIARIQRETREAEAAEQKRLDKLKPPRDTDAELRTKAVQKQIEQIDDSIRDCNDDATLVKLVAAKATLYALIYPKPGSLRPRQSKSRSSEPAEPTEVE